MRGAALGVLGALAIGALIPLAANGAGASAPALYAKAQASAGEKTYESKCSLCHGANLEGGAGPPLSGPNMTTLGTKTHLTVGDMFGYIVSNMPMNAPASLSHDQYVAVLSYILNKNGYPAGSKPLTYASANASKAIVRSYK
jgi:polar amino acid transport system substrate-binding protein